MAAQQARRLAIELERNRSEDLRQQFRERSRFTRAQEQAEQQRKAEREDAMARRHAWREPQARKENEIQDEMKASVRLKRRKEAVATRAGNDRREKDWRRLRLINLPDERKLLWENKRNQILEQSRAARQAEALALKRWQDVLEESLRSRRQRNAESEGRVKRRESPFARHPLRMRRRERKDLLRPRGQDVERVIRTETVAVPASFAAGSAKAQERAIRERWQERPRPFEEQKERLSRHEPAIKAPRHQLQLRELAKQKLEALRQLRLSEQKSQELLQKVRARQRLESVETDKQAEKSIFWRMREFVRRRQKKITDATLLERRAGRWGRHRPLPARQAKAQRADGALPPLKTLSNQIVHRDGNPIRLRGVNVQGLDNELFITAHEFRRRLGLHVRGLQVLNEQWQANLVRLPFDAGRLWTEIQSATGQQRLEVLDEIVDEAARHGIYVLLSGLDTAPVADASIPGQSAIACWKLLAHRYHQHPAVLYEVRSEAGAGLDARQKRRRILLAAIRQASPGSLIFLCEDDVSPALQTLDWPRPESGAGHNLVYSADLPPGSFTADGVFQLRVLARRVPVLTACWREGGVISARLGHGIAAIQQRLGSGSVTFNWNAEPRVVVDAAADDFTPTPLGMIVRRAVLIASELHPRPGEQF